MGQNPTMPSLFYPPPIFTNGEVYKHSSIDARWSIELANTSHDAPRQPLGVR